MGSGAELTYDRAANIVFIRFREPVELRTEEAIAAHFEKVVSFWQAQAGGRKAYFVVDFDNVTVDPAAIDFYAGQTKWAHEVCAIASVRYGGAPLQRTVTRLAGMKNQQPSNICGSRAEALAMIEALKKAE